MQAYVRSFEVLEREEVSELIDLLDHTPDFGALLLTTTHAQYHTCDENRGNRDASNGSSSDIAGRLVLTTR
jgi:hypothetical protein